MTALRLESVSKHFGAIHALNDVSMSLAPGEVVGLMGDNGAGKSTLVKVIAGNYRPTSGKIFIKDREAIFHRPVEARQNGIEIVYQDLALCDNLSAAVNVFLGRELTRRIGPFKILDYAAMNKAAARLFKDLRSETRPKDMVRLMSGGQRQAVAIARTRLSNPDIVLMDEPTAAISVRQVAEVLNLIRELQQARHRRGADQPPHAGRLRGGRPDRGAEARQQGRRQADRRNVAGGDHRPHHRRDRTGLNRGVDKAFTWPSGSKTR